MEHVANIDERGASRRRTGGIVWLVIALASTVAMALLHARAGWYAVLVVPFAMAALGFFQARERT
jgi:hypothetical protein